MQSQLVIITKINPVDITGRSGYASSLNGSFQCTRSSHLNYLCPYGEILKLRPLIHQQSCTPGLSPNHFGGKTLLFDVNYVTSDMTASTYLKEGHCRAILNHSILNLGLLGQVISRVNWRFHSLHGEEGGQVGRIGGDDDQGKKPPDSSYYPGGKGFGHELRSQQRGAEIVVRVKQ